MSNLQEYWDAAPELAQRMAHSEDAAKAELDALRKDAERYRWLRARPLHDDEIFISVDSAKHPNRWGLGGNDPAGCDAAIDAAMAGTPAVGAA